MTGPAASARLRPVNVLGALADLLRAHGITRLYGSACAMIGVLSVAYGLSVWCDGRQLWWHRDGNRLTWPAGDLEGAARLLASSAAPADQPGPYGSP